MDCGFFYEYFWPLFVFAFLADILFLSAVSTPSTAQKAVVYGTITDDTSGDIARIKNGTDKIDPDYCIRFDKTEIGGLNGLKGEFLSTILYGGNGKLYAYANVYALDPNAMTNPYVCLSNVPVVIDLARKTVERIEADGDIQSTRHCHWQIQRPYCFWKC